MTDNAEQMTGARPRPAFVTLNYAEQWDVVTPAVYRYEDKQWIDEFFETGKLRLGTFKKFSTYKDENRGDAFEGTAICTGLSGNFLDIILQKQGSNSAVLCCSHKLHEDLRIAFERDSAFAITNTFGFAREIARQLPGFTGGFEGSCIYRDDGTIVRVIAHDDDEYKLPDGSYSFQSVRDLSEKLGGHELMLLKNDSYEHQQEYRLMWHLDNIENQYIDVIAPLAVQFCTRLHKI